MRGSVARERDEFVQTGLDLVAQHVEIGHARAIGANAEGQPARVGDDHNPNRVVGGERDDRNEPDHRRTKHVHRLWRSRDIRDRDVEQATRVQGLREAGVQYRRCELGQPDQGLGAERLPRDLCFSAAARTSS